ncbi:MAG: hypothetical protein ACYTG1_02590 [Planctomycetota bacterium]|jgi:hypothetical protein
MQRDRLVQLVALVVLLASGAACGALLPSIINESDERALRYTNVSVEGAPPFVALGTAIGALRGVIVDYLWIKVHIMKEKGLFYEVMADAELITRLQPRFAAVWAFHGHNMAYNISVATYTLEERWEWVNAGIRLVRNEGLRYNPNDMVLHKELAFWFAHKIEGVSDDAHLFYKREFCREWHGILGQPPEGHEEMIEWMQAIADAPASLQEAEARAPGVAAIVEQLRGAFPVGQEQFRFALDAGFLTQYAFWQAVTGQSEVARIMGYEQEVRTSPYFEVFTEVATDPARAEAWETLIRHVRRRVLEDEYNMSPQRMADYTRTLGPLDWRHGQAHALYWSRRGSELGQGRVNREDVYKVINTDRIQMQAMQALARSGRITFDWFSNEMPSRFPDPRWIDVIDREWDSFYVKHYDTRGWGGDTFIGFLENFMGSAIREWYRSGEHERAQRMLDKLDERFGSGAVPPSPKYQIPLDVFVKNEVFDQYQAQPFLAPSEVAASLRYGLRVGVGMDRKEVWEEAKAFAFQVTEFFKNNEWYDYRNQFGVGRIADLIGQLDQSRDIAFIQLMTDPSMSMEERMRVWQNIDRYERDLRLRTYDVIMPALARQYEATALARQVPLAEAFPEPPGLEIFRRQRAAERLREQEAAEAARERDEIMRK